MREIGYELAVANTVSVGADRTLVDGRFAPWRRRGEERLGCIEVRIPIVKHLSCRSEAPLVLHDPARSLSFLPDEFFSVSFPSPATCGPSFLLGELRFPANPSTGAE